MPIDPMIFASSDLPKKIFRRLARHPMIVMSVASIGLRVGREAFRLQKGQINGREFRARTGGHLGSIGGGALGATAGAVAGSVVPVLGSIIGGFAGGILGEAGGSRLGRMAAEGLDDLIGGKKPDDGPDLRPPKRDL